MNWNPFRKLRKYPIQYDEYGRSLRQQAFALYRSGRNYREVTGLIPIKLSTARRYYFIWKKRPENLEFDCRMVKRAFKSNPGFKILAAKAIAEELHCPVAEILSEMEIPWAYHKMARRYWRDRIAEARQRTRLQAVRAAARIVHLYNRAGVPMTEILQALGELVPGDNSRETGRGYRHTRPHPLYD